MDFSIKLLLFLFSLIPAISHVHSSTLTSDPTGYVAFCPCMGRFGNQLEHYLGALSFAKQLNRTLILPPLIDYPSSQTYARMTDFENIFDLKEIEKFHRVVPMGKFMRELAPEIWPKNKRKAYCWGPRKSIYDEEAPPSCNAKEGNPFGPFWDYSGVEFVADEYFSPNVQSGFDMARYTAKQEWDSSYPASSNPVLAFVSAPASFPIKDEDRQIQKYLKFRPRITDKAIKFIKEYLPRPFVAIHLRNNMDWDSVCKSLKDGQKVEQLFASPQCLGYYNEHGTLTAEMCSPSESTIIDQVEDAVNGIGAKAVFVSSDKDHLLPELNDRLKKIGVEAFKLTDDDPYVSLAILQRADHFIGNCVSTFTSFVTRAREFGSRNDLKKTSFFGFEPIGRSKIEL